MAKSTPAKRKAAREKASDSLNEAQATLTARIIDALESDPGNWTKPWVEAAAGGLPHNVVSGKPYRGGNALWFWSIAIDNGYATSCWASFKQWKDLGRSVRKGEKSSFGIYWKRWSRTEDEGTPDERTRSGLTPFIFRVFNFDQTDAVADDAWTPELPDPVDRIEAADEFFAAIGATVTHGPGGAFYSPGSDRINVPSIDSFVDAESYYATLAHEHGHWTGHRSRLARPGIVGFDGFGSEQYAREELVAELASVFTCSHLSLSSEPRPDHAQYLASWIKRAKAEPSFIWKAANEASKATELLVNEAEAGSTPEAEIEFPVIWEALVGAEAVAA
jgi:antirestriction protein ArdC